MYIFDAKLYDLLGVVSPRKRTFVSPMVSCESECLFDQYEKLTEWCGLIVLHGYICTCTVGNLHGEHTKT